MPFIQRERALRLYLPYISEKCIFIAQIMNEKYHPPVRSETEIFRDPGEELHSFLIMPAEKDCSVYIELKKIRKSLRRIILRSEIVKLSGLDGSSLDVRFLRVLLR